MPKGVLLSWNEYLQYQSAGERETDLQRQLDVANLAAQELPDVVRMRENTVAALKQTIIELRASHRNLSEDYEIVKAQAMAHEQELAEVDELLETNARQAENLAKMETTVKELRARLLPRNPMIF